MNERIKKIRKDAQLTQEEFGKRLGVKRNTVATYEMGRSTPIDGIIFSICREFGVNEEWLRDGIGDPYKSKNGSFSELLSDLEDGDDDFIKDLICAYMDLDDNSKSALKKFAGILASRTRQT